MCQLAKTPPTRPCSPPSCLINWTRPRPRQAQAGIGKFHLHTAITLGGRADLNDQRFYTGYPLARTLKLKMPAWGVWHELA